MKRRKAEPTSEQIAEAMLGARAFAGVDPAQYAVGWASPQPLAARSESREITVLRLLERMTGEERDRVLEYALGRWLDVKGAGQ